MPRIKPLARPYDEMLIEEQLINFNKGAMYMDLKTIGDFVHNANREDLADWLAGTPCWIRGKQRKKKMWNVSDVAHLIYSQTDYSVRGQYFV